MEEKELREFAWSALFTVTACCSFVFNIIIKLLDGSFSDLMLVVGIIASFLGVLNWAGRFMSRQSSKKRRTRKFAS